MNLKATIITKKNSSFKTWFSKKNNWISKINFKIKLNSEVRKRSNLNNFSILWKCLKTYEPKDWSIKTKFNLFLYKLRNCKDWYNSRSKIKKSIYNLLKYLKNTIKRNKNFNKSEIKLKLLQKKTAKSW